MSAITQMNDDHMRDEFRQWLRLWKKADGDVFARDKLITTLKALTFIHDMNFDSIFLELTAFNGRNML